MKFFALVLVFYIMGLVIMPCPDVLDHNALQKTESSLNRTPGHQNESDLCSPFCTCNCCAHSVMCQHSFPGLNHFTFSDRAYPDYSTGFVSSVYASFWQPPKIS